MAKTVLNMSDKLLFIKLHINGLENSKLLNNKSIILVNSAITKNNIALTDIIECNKAIKLMDSSKIPFFNNKNNLYEAGIIINNDLLSNKIKNINNLLTQTNHEQTAINAYKHLSTLYKKEFDEFKTTAYNYLIKYIGSFCGPKYAKSISDKNLICQVHKYIDEALQVHDYSIGAQTDKKKLFHPVILYKIGYSIGLK